MSAEDWTEERVALARRLYEIGQSASQIAKALALTGFSCSRNAVIGKLVRLGCMGSISPVLRKERNRGAAVKRENERVKLREKLVRQAVELKPVRAKGGVADAAVNIAFTARAPNQCANFLEGQDGPDGLICARPVVVHAWCEHCAALVYDLSAKVGKKAA